MDNSKIVKLNVGGVSMYFNTTVTTSSTFISFIYFLDVRRHLLPPLLPSCHVERPSFPSFSLADMRVNVMKVELTL